MMPTALIQQNDHAPIVISDQRAQHANPLHLRSDCPIALPRQHHRIRANETALRRQNSGFFPSVGQEADTAALTLRGCQHVILDGLCFERCWPTAIYIDNCQNITIRNCSFKGGTVAIGAHGSSTRDIIVEGCDWVQEEDIWRGITWEAIHGSFSNAERAVDVKNDHRHLDGDFFRAWDIAGQVTIRNNLIKDAFNGIHFFNTIDATSSETATPDARYNKGRRASLNVVVENNRFVRIRDNCIEPEDYAWNWIVRGNSFIDCYAPYSFELNRAAYFYIYDNHHLWANPPREGEKGTRTDGSGFKLGLAQRNEGDIHIFHNSWLSYGKFRYLRKKALGRMTHFSNALQHLSTDGRLFGEKGTDDWRPGMTQKELVKLDQKSFTRRFQHYEITMDGDCINFGKCKDDYLAVGYDTGANSDFSAFEFKSYRSYKDRIDLIVLRRDGKSKADKTITLPGYREASDARVADTTPYRFSIPADWRVGAGLTTEQRRWLDGKLGFNDHH